jgi:hypothetical protein
MSSPLDKVLQLAQPKDETPEPGSDIIRVLVQAARVALTGACGSDDPATTAELVYMAAAQVESLAKMLATDTVPMELVSVTLTGQPLEDETIGLSVLTAKGRKQAKTDGYTIAGSDDYPIPDKAHLSAAVGRYKEGAFAGHPSGTVKAHILKHARRLGVEVELVAPAVLSQIRDGEATVFLAAPPEDQDVPMHHAPFTGKHRHAHETTMAHGHDHEHHGDSDHAGSVHGKNPKEKAWPNKGESRHHDW